MRGALTWGLGAFVVHAALAGFALLDYHFRWVKVVYPYDLLRKMDFLVEPLLRWQGWLPIMEWLYRFVGLKTITTLLELTVFILAGGLLYFSAAFLLALAMRRPSTAPDAIESRP